jgi:hypothetical protein
MKDREDWTKVTLRLPPKLHAQMAEFAKRENTSLNGAIIRVLSAGIRDRGGEIRKKRSDTLVRTLREEYGDHFAPGFGGFLDDSSRNALKVAIAAYEQALAKKDQ